MADTELSALTEDTAPAQTDWLYKVDSGGTADRKVSVANMAAAMVGGAHVTRTSGDVTLNSTSWANVDTGADCTVTANAGDILVAMLSGFLANESPQVNFDAVTVVGGVVTNTFNGSAEGSSDGNPGWLTLGSIFSHVCGQALYTVQAGDISSGQVTVRLRYKTDSASNRTLRRNTSLPLKFGVIRIPA